MDRITEPNSSEANSEILPVADGAAPIFDPAFATRLQRVKDRLSFLETSNVDLSAEDRTRLRSSAVYGVRVVEREGSSARPASATEWDNSDVWLSVLSVYDTPELRRRIYFETHGKRDLAAYPGAAMIRALAFLLAGILFAAMGFPLNTLITKVQSHVDFPLSANPGSTYVHLVAVITFCGWSFYLGKAGAAASLALNLLALQKDAAFDITEPSLVNARIMTGGVFAFVLSLAVGIPPYRDFLSSLIEAKDNAFERSLLILLPFVFGFSTNLVIAILHQFVGAVQTFFNVRPER
jgi:hypothetical protein